MWKCLVVMRGMVPGLALVLAWTCLALAQAGPDATAGAEKKPKLSITLEGYETQREAPVEKAPAVETPAPAAPVILTPAVPTVRTPATSVPDDLPVASPSVPARSPQVVPESVPAEPATPGGLPSARSTAKVVPSPTPPPAPVRSSSRPVPYQPAPRRESRPSPVLSMLDSTVHGSYSNTRAIARNLAGKYVEHVGDRALAQKLSRQANELLNKADRPAEAAEIYRRAYEQDPSSSEITGSYGYALFRSGHFAEARDMEIESLEIAPEYGAAWFVLGQIYGYLKQEDLACASFVNTCLFSKGIGTTLGYLEREKAKYGEPTAQRAAGRALDICRRVASGSGAQDAAVARRAPSEPAPLRSDEADMPPADAPGPRTSVAPSPAYESEAVAPVGSPGAAPAGSVTIKKTGKIGMVDIQAVVNSSRQFPEILARVGQASKWERDRRLDEMLTPLLNDIRSITREYAQANRFSLVIIPADEGHLRGGDILSPGQLPLADVDEGYLAYLNTPEGMKYRRTAPIQDLTAIVTAKLNAR